MEDLDGHEVAVDVEGGADVLSGGCGVDLDISGSREEGEVYVVGVDVFFVLAHVVEETWVVVAGDEVRAVVVFDVVGKCVEVTAVKAFEHVGENDFDDKTLRDCKTVGDGVVSIVHCERLDCVSDSVSEVECFSQASFGGVFGNVFFFDEHAFFE